MTPSNSSRCNSSDIRCLLSRVPITFAIRSRAILASGTHLEELVSRIFIPFVAKREIILIARISQAGSLRRNVRQRIIYFVPSTMKSVGLGQEVRLADLEFCYRDSMALKIGDQVADYQIIDFLGQGGMGAVYRVRNLISERDEALKVLVSSISASEEVSTRFMREIKIHASLEHPNIAALHTAFWADNQLMMVMELVDGINLDERLRQGPVTVHDAVHWIAEVLSALSYAHAAGVIHRDIKPANILLTASGKIKLVDFGIARSASTPGLTSTGMALGSLSYMAPEVIQAAEPDVRSDIYAVGVTLFELLTGGRPWAGRNDYEIMKARFETDPISPDRINPNVPSSLAAIVLRALAVNPDQRFQSAEEFSSALEAFHPGRSATASFSVTPARMPPHVTGNTTRITKVFSNVQPVWSGQQTGKFSVATNEPSGALNKSVIETITKELAQYVGPIARLLVQRGTTKHTNIRSLTECLAAEIPSWSERERFLNALAHLQFRSSGNSERR